MGISFTNTPAAPRRYTRSDEITTKERAEGLMERYRLRSLPPNKRLKLTARVEH